MSVSLRDVANAAKVSVGTVSNVLNRPELVAAPTRQRVAATIKELGFVPNGFARQLRSGHGNTLGLVVPDVANPFFTEVARGVEDAASKRSYAVFLCNSDESVTKESKYINVLIQQQVRGVLITPASKKPENLNLLMEREIAVTLLDRESKNLAQCSVSVDDVRGGEMGIEYLAGLGHKNIAFVCGPEEIPQVADRKAGVKSAALAAKIKIQPIEVDLMNSAAGDEAAKKIMKLDAKPTAIFCANDLLAIGVMRSLAAAGWKVPTDVSILGYDDIAFAPNSSVPLSSIAQPAYQVGHTAAELILSECEDPDTHAHQHIKFQPQLVERASTSALN